MLVEISNAHLQARLFPTPTLLFFLYEVSHTILYCWSSTAIGRVIEEPDGHYPQTIKKELYLKKISGRGRKQFWKLKFLKKNSSGQIPTLKQGSNEILLDTNKAACCSTPLVSSSRHDIKSMLLLHISTFYSSHGMLQTEDGNPTYPQTEYSKSYYMAKFKNNTV